MDDKRSFLYQQVSCILIRISFTSEDLSYEQVPGLFNLLMFPWVRFSWRRFLIWKKMELLMYYLNIKMPTRVWLLISLNVKTRVIQHSWKYKYFQVHVISSVVLQRQKLVFLLFQYLLFYSFTFNSDPKYRK